MQSEHIRVLFITVTITLSIASNNLRVQQIQNIQVYTVAQVPPHTIWWRCQQENLYTQFNRACWHSICGFVAETRLPTVASIVLGL